jgi:carboxyl-terminal processing protease
VLDIGEGSAPNALEYDTIPAREFAFSRKDELPVEQLNASLQGRLATNTEFQYVMEESKRIKERIDKNTVSLSIEDRRRERDEGEVRREKQEQLRKARAEEVAKQVGDKGFKTYQLTLDNVDAKELTLMSDVTSEQRSGMRVADEAEGEEKGGAEFPYGIEPAKLETLNILRDYIQVVSGHPTTAETSAKKE